MKTVPATPSSKPAVARAPPSRSQLQCRPLRRRRTGPRQETAGPAGKRIRSSDQRRRRQYSLWFRCVSLRHQPAVSVIERSCLSRYREENARRGAPGDGKSSRGRVLDRFVRVVVIAVLLLAGSSAGAAAQVPSASQEPIADTPQPPSPAAPVPTPCAHVCALRAGTTPPPGTAGAAAGAGKHRLRCADSRHRQRLRVVSAPQEHVGNPRHRRWRGRPRLSVGRRDQQRIAGSQYPRRRSWK